MNEYNENWERQPQASEPPKKKKSGVIALALVCAILGCALGVGLTGLRQPSIPAEQTTTLVEGLRKSSVIQKVQMDTGRQMTQAEVYAANVRSTVGITTSVTTNYWGFQTTSAASGSGFIISSDGYILTNHHVIENSSAITVTTYDGESYDAQLVGYDSSNDIAVLKVEAQDLPPVILGDSDNLNVGDPVMAIGNPLGELTFTLTAGFVSAKDRQVTLSGGVTMNLIQTDTAINSGNSGGALFNLYGEVIGVTNAKYSSSSSGASIDNIGFAIPINTILPIVESIIEHGYVAKPYIGVSIATVGADSQLYGVPQGAAVQSVVEDGPAAKAGLKAGDIITQVGDTAVTTSDDLKKQVSASRPGDELTMSVYRQGQTLEITVSVEEQRQEALPEKTVQTQPNMMPWGFRR